LRPRSTSMTCLPRSLSIKQPLGITVPRSVVPAIGLTPARPPRLTSVSGDDRSAQAVESAGKIWGRVDTTQGAVQLQRRRRGGRAARCENDLERRPRGVPCCANRFL
jgi:hypothetical protein